MKYCGCHAIIIVMSGLRFFLAMGISATSSQKLWVLIMMSEELSKHLLWAPRHISFPTHNTNEMAKLAYNLGNNRHQLSTTLDACALHHNEDTYISCRCKLHHLPHIFCHHFKLNLNRKNHLPGFVLPEFPWTQQVKQRPLFFEKQSLGKDIGFLGA